MDPLEPDAQHGQHVVQQKGPAVVAQVDEVIVEYLRVQHAPIEQPEDRAQAQQEQEAEGVSE